MGDGEQIAADAAQSLIVDVQVTQAANDSEQLAPAVGRIAARLGRKPQQMLADGDYTNRRSIEAMAELDVDYVGSLRKGGARRQHRHWTLQGLAAESGVLIQKVLPGGAAERAGLARRRPAGVRGQHAHHVGRRPHRRHRR